MINSIIVDICALFYAVDPSFNVNIGKNLTSVFLDIYNLVDDNP